MLNNHISGIYNKCSWLTFALICTKLLPPNTGGTIMLISSNINMIFMHVKLEVLNTKTDELLERTCHSFGLVKMQKHNHREVFKSGVSFYNTRQFHCSLWSNYLWKSLIEDFQDFSISIGIYWYFLSGNIHFLTLNIT